MLCNICQISSSAAFAVRRPMSAIHGQFSVVAAALITHQLLCEKSGFAFALSAHRRRCVVSLSAWSQTITITLLQEPHKSAGELHTHALGGGRTPMTFCVGRNCGHNSVTRSTHPAGLPRKKNARRSRVHEY
jgi:hypothetical protein